VSRGASPGPPEGGSYIRGGGGAHIGGRRVARFVVGFGILILAALTVIFLVAAIDHNSRFRQLEAHGVAVDVTVTGCVGMASGTGITEAGFKCRGTFTLGNHAYNEVIGGTADLQAVGQKLPAVVVPGDPSILYTARAVANTRTSWAVYITPTALLLVLIAAALLWRRLRPRDGADLPFRS
jgi:hypothetical protein